MAISLRGLLRTATRGVTAGLQGAEEGREISRQRRREDEERQRRMESDALKKSLLEFDVEAAAREADRAALAPDLEEARLSERAAGYQQQYGEAAVPSGLAPAIAVERGQAAEKAEQERVKHERAKELAGARTAAAQPGRDAIEHQRNFQREQALVDDYDRTVRPWLVPYNALTRAQRNVAEARAGDTAAQIQMLYAFINSLDNSVVREGEANMFARAAPLLERAKQQVNKLALGKGAVMPPEQVEEVARILDQVSQSFADRFDAFKAQYSNRAKRWNIDPESFMDIPDVFGKPEPETDELTAIIEELRDASGR